MELRALLLLLLAASQPGAALGVELEGDAEKSGLRQRLWDSAGGAETHSDPPAPLTAQPARSKYRPPQSPDPRPPAPAGKRKVPVIQPDWTDPPPAPLPLASSDVTQDRRSSEPNTKTRSPSGPNTETQSPSEPNTETQSPSEPNTETQSPSELNTETQSLSEPNIKTQSLSGRNTKTRPPSRHNIQTQFPSEPNTETQSPSELNTETQSLSGPNTETQSPSRQNIEAQSPSVLNIETRPPSGPNTKTSSRPNTRTQSLSVPNTETQSPSVPNIETQSPSVPNIETQSPSVPNIETQSPSRQNSENKSLSGPYILTQSPLGPNTETQFSPGSNIETQSPPGLNSGTSYSLEPNRTSRLSLLHAPPFPLVRSDRTEDPRPSNPTRRRKVPVTEPYWTESSSPERTESNQSSEPNPESRSPPGPVRWESGPSVLADTEEARTLAVPAQMGHRSPYTWDSAWTEGDVTQTDGQMSSASGITPKSVTRRHISKRTPHMDTTRMSTTFPQEESKTFSSMANETGVSNITENPTTNPTDLDTDTPETRFTAKDSGNTSRHSGGMTQVSVTGAKDSGDTTQDSGNTTQDFGNTTQDSGNTTLDSGNTTQDSGNTTQDSGNTTQDSGNTTQDSGNTTQDSGNTTQDSVTVTQGSGNSTETFRIERTASGLELSAPITYPLQTPSYLMTTHLTSHHTSESATPFTSIPTIFPNTTVIPLSKSTVLSSSDSSSSYSGPSTSTLTSVVSSSGQPSSPYSDVTTFSNQSASDISSSSPIPSTLVASPFSTTSIFPSEIPPQFTSTKPSEAPTTLPTTTLPPSLSSLPSLPPPSHTAPSSIATEMSTSYRISSPPTGTDEPSGGHNSSTTSLSESSSVDTEPGRRFVEGSTTALYDLPTTARSIPETQTAGTSADNRRTPSITEIPHLTESPDQPTNPIPSTTSSYHLIPSPRYGTPGFPYDVSETTRSQGPTVTTNDPNKQMTTNRTTTVDVKTVTPRPETTTSTKGKRKPPQALSPPGVVTARYPTTTEGQLPTPPTPARTAPPAPAPVLCSPNPCLNGGVCMERSRHKGYRCECPAAWQGRHCDTDVNECESSPCPAQATCINQPGSFHCRCPLGYIMERGAGCIQVRTFLGHIEVPRSFLNGSRGIYTKLQQIEEEIVHILNSSFSPISGYHESSVINSSFSSLITLSVQNTFLLSSNVSIQDLKYNIQRYFRVCQSVPQPSAACSLFLHPQFTYKALSLCSVKNLGCDNETAECADPSGIASCQCKPGYFKYSKMDHSCRACDDGYKLQEGACVRCPFGLGGFNCSNPYQLITVIIAAAGGGLLLILGVALAVTCCRKSKHDISKLIFKSGDFQMSPYAEYPKSQRSAEWGRETIEMQENGSTKNLLQMTDVYYSPGLRNSEMERNGLYPYTGVPGSRHSCIYPGQYNPTFINEENRRRDYF